MQQVPIPPEWLPDGAELSPSGMSYSDALQLPVVNAEPENGNGIPRVAVTRTSHLFELDQAEAKALVDGGWRLWVRHTMIAGQLQLDLEPAQPPVPTYPFLDSEMPDEGVDPMNPNLRPEEP